MPTNKVPANSLHSSKYYSWKELCLFFSMFIFSSRGTVLSILDIFHCFVRVHVSSVAFVICYSLSVFILSRSPTNAVSSRLASVPCTRTTAGMPVRWPAFIHRRRRSSSLKTHLLTHSWELCDTYTTTGSYVSQKRAARKTTSLAPRGPCRPPRTLAPRLPAPCEK